MNMVNNAKKDQYRKILIFLIYCVTLKFTIMKKYVFVFLTLVLGYSASKLMAQSESGINILSKWDSTFLDYKVNSIKQIPTDILVKSKCNLTYFTKMVNGYMGDVELKKEEIMKLNKMMQDSLNTSITLPKNSKSIYQLLAIISTKTPSTYMDNNGYPWNVVEGYYFFLNKKEKSLIHYERITVYVSNAEAAVSAFVKKASSKFSDWIKN